MDSQDAMVTAVAYAYAAFASTAPGTLQTMRHAMESRNLEAVMLQARTLERLSNVRYSVLYRYSTVTVSVVESEYTV